MKVSMTHGHVKSVQQENRGLCGLPVQQQSPELASSGDCKTQLNADRMSFRNLEIELSPPGFLYSRTKRCLDLSVSAIAFIPFIFICSLISILNEIWSPGPLFFKQSRIGHRGEPFTLIKFRTMIVDKECMDSLLTADRDPRITRVGKLLRRTRLDELPQLINVIRGEMSWIGPRPEATALSKLYQRTLPNYKYRHIILPGITGWAQINQGHVTKIKDIRTKLSYDLFFIKNASIWLELRILFRTIPILISGYGAK